MNRNYFLIISIFSILTGYSILGIAQNQIHFSGNIANCPDSNFEIGKVDKPNDASKWQKVKIKNGSFSVVINTKEPTVLRCFFKDKEFDFYAMPGDSLILTSDYNKLLATTRFEGKGKETAQFHPVWEQNFNASHKTDFENRRNLTPQRYLELRKNLLDLEMAFLNDYVVKYGLKESPFFNYYVTDFKFSFYDALCSYITDHNNIEKDGIKPEYFPLLKLLDEIDYNDPNFVETKAYRWFFMGYINQLKYRQLIYEKILPEPAKDSAFWFTRCYILSKKILNEKAHESYAMTAFFEFLTPLTVNSLAPYYGHFIQSCSQENRLILGEAFKKYKKLSESHKISSNSQIKKTDVGLKEILDEFKGSLLYVDFWASWCAPCIGEMPASKELQKKFKDKDVKFLFISVDQDEDSWKKAISVYEIPGIHYRLDKVNRSDLVDKLLSNGVPHYLIVGRDGNIIAQDAKSPSDPSLVSELEKLLEN